MGKRGRNRQGLYVALLYVLDLHYERESQIHGNDPAAWRPAPRNRPDQFCAWALDALQTLGVPAPGSFGDLVGELSRLRLPRVASMLSHSMARRVESEDRPLDELDPEDALERLGLNRRAAERHPQARKFAHTVSDALDEAWCRALAATAEEYAALDDLPRTALLLGGLPPSFAVLNDYIFQHLDDAELVRDHLMLTVLQFYGLVTGTVPPPPPTWRRALDALSGLERSDLERLASLTERQVDHLRRLGDDAPALLDLRQRLRCSASRWLALGAALRRNGEASEEEAKDAARAAGAAAHHGLASRDELRRLADSAAWRELAEPNEEVARMLRQGDLSPELTTRLANWSDAVTAEVQQLLLDHRGWAVAYLEDRKILEGLFSSRTCARLNMRELFPKTTAWLDRYLGEHIESALIEDVGDLETVAAVVSRRIRQQL